MSSSDEDARMFTIVSSPRVGAIVAQEFVLKLRADLAINPTDKITELFEKNKIRAVVALKAGNREDAGEHLKGTEEVLGKYLRVDQTSGRHHYDFRFDDHLRILKDGSYILDVRLEALDDAGKWKPVMGMNRATAPFYVSKPFVPTK